jgi:hypothetical protein
MADAIPEVSEEVPQSQAEADIPEAMSTMGENELGELTNLEMIEQLQQKMEQHNKEEEKHQSVPDGVWEGDPGDGTDFIIVEDLPIEDHSAMPSLDIFDRPMMQNQSVLTAPVSIAAPTTNTLRYEFNDIEVGQYTVQGMKTGFETNTKSIVVTENGVASGDMQMRTATTGFNLNVEYLDFGNHFNTLTFKIINASTTTPMSWEIFESLNWLTVTPNTGNLQGGQEVTLTVTIDRTLINQNTTGNITIHSADMDKILPVSVSL